MPDSELPSLMSVEKACHVLDATPILPRTRRVSLNLAQGYRLAEDLKADRDYPPFEKSLMDGYAVRCADLQAGQIDLHVVGEIAAGTWTERALQAGETMAIMTGAPLPAGADGVVPVEHVATRVPVGGRVHLTRSADPRRYVAGRGSDCLIGKVVLKKGDLIGPAQIAVAASIGAAEILCFAKPRIAILGTRDELVRVDQIPGASQIRDSNTHMLAALLPGLGCDVAEVAHVRDDREFIREAILRGLSHDALFITGGMSMGEYDYVPRLLVELNVELKITKLRIKPGKPFVFGMSKSSSSEPGKPIFGLPGNPVSAYVCTIRLASRLLARMAGGTAQERWITGQLQTDLPANGPREFYQPAWITYGTADEPNQITPLGWKGSADIFTLATANAFIVRDENVTATAKNTTIRVLQI